MTKFLLTWSTMRPKWSSTHTSMSPSSSFSHSTNIFHMPRTCQVMNSVLGAHVKRCGYLSSKSSLVSQEISIQTSNYHKVCRGLYGHSCKIYAGHQGSQRRGDTSLWGWGAFAGEPSGYLPHAEVLSTGDRRGPMVLQPHRWRPTVHLRICASGYWTQRSPKGFDTSP